MTPLNQTIKDKNEPHSMSIIYIDEIYNFIFRNKKSILLITLIIIVGSIFIPIKKRWQVIGSLQFENSDNPFTFISGIASQYFINDIKNPYGTTLTANTLLNEESFLFKITALEILLELPFSKFLPSL